MTEPPAPEEFDEVVCPFCGLGCDGLRVSVDRGKPEVIGESCSMAHRGFQQASNGQDASPEVGGTSASLDEAIRRAASLLRAARLPLIAGLATDVSGARAVMTLARRCGATVDHMTSPGLFRNLQVLQDGGWMTASLTEVRNRSDLIVVAGARVFELFPRLLERVFHPGVCALPNQGKKRELVLIGPWKPSTLPPEVADWRPTIIPVGLPAIWNVAASLRALVADRPLQVCGVEGVDINTLTNLARRLQQADYSVVAWAAGELDLPHAELIVQCLVELVRDLNVTTRSAALPLGGAQGDVTMNQVCTWESGRPLRTSFSRGRAEHDAIIFDHRRMLASGQADMLFWISTFMAQTPPPETDVPTVVVGHPGIGLIRTPSVFIPVGIPGVDHGGHVFRGDGVVVLPLRQLRKTALPPAAEVIQSITAALDQG